VRSIRNYEDSSGLPKENSSTNWQGKQTAAEQHRRKDLYDLTKKLSGKKSSASNPSKITRKQTHQGGKTAEEVVRIQNGKSPCQDGINAEDSKADMKISTQMLYEIFERVWEEEAIPDDWKEGHLVKITKKGDLPWGITMLSVPGKILSRVILQRLIYALGEILGDQQMGFRKNRSCTDHIANLRIITEQSLEWNSSLNHIHRLQKGI